MNNYSIKKVSAVIGLSLAAGVFCYYWLTGALHVWGV